MKQIRVLLACLMLACMIGISPARAEGPVVTANEQFRLDPGKYIDSFRLDQGGILFLRGAPNWDSLHLVEIKDGVVTDLDTVLLDQQIAPTAINANACGTEIHLFIGWEDGQMQYVYWSLGETLAECKKSVTFFPVAGYSP